MTTESVLQQMLEPLYRAKGWLKFVGVLSIIQGVLSILSIWGILICWLPIWLGVILFSAANQLERAFEAEDTGAARTSMAKLASYFRIAGVLTVVMLVLAFIGVGAAILIPVLVHAHAAAMPP